MKDLIKYGFILCVICLAAAGLLASINLLTAGRILAQAQSEELASLKEVMPQAESFEAVKDDSGQTLYYNAFDKDKNIIGYAFKASGRGYSSVIETMVGMLTDGTISGIKVLSQNETPGLGARICEIQEDRTIFDIGKKEVEPSLPKKPWFQEQFINKKLDNLNEVQAITGATISSKAVIDSVEQRALEIQELIGKNAK